MEEIIKQLKELIAKEEESAVRIGLRTALMVVYEQYQKELI